MMDSSRVIRVHIDRHPLSTSPSSIPAGQTTPIVLSEELARLEAALASGNHLSFEWPTWMHRAKAGVAQTAPPPATTPSPVCPAPNPATLEFQRQMHEDMQKMLSLLQTMAEMMAPSQGLPAAAPASLVVIQPPPVAGEMFYPFPPGVGLASWKC